MTDRLYYTDSFLTEFDAVVTEIHELSRDGGQSLWRVALDRSAFYPASGGQPHDTGQLTATARSGAELIAEIVGVEEDDAGHVWHRTSKPLQAGTQVRGGVDAARRFDHMQQHSGQHLLSAAFLRVCNAPTLSFHLGEAISTVDVSAENISAVNLRNVEELANKVVAEDRPVTAALVSRQQAEAWLASGELRKLPPREGDLRIIEIADFDRNACGGTHVRSTGQIGGLHLRGIEKVRQGVRVEFVCGLRAIRAARDDFEILTEAGHMLAVGFAGIPDSIERLQSRSKQIAKDMERTAEELAQHRAAKLVRETPVQGDLRLVRLHLGPPEYASVADAKLLASRLVGSAARTVAIFAWRPAKKDDPATIVFARSEDMSFDCGTLLRQTLAAMGERGGGSKDMAQGAVPASRVDAVMDALAAGSELARDVHSPAHKPFVA